MWLSIETGPVNPIVDSTDGCNMYSKYIYQLTGSVAHTFNSNIYLKTKDVGD